MTATPEPSGQAVLSVQEKEIIEIRIEVPSPDIVIKPNPVMDGSKLIDGIVSFVKWGLTVVVTNGVIKKEDEGSEGQSEATSKDITSRHVRTQIFGNGFENDERPEDTPDPLKENYIADLEFDKQVDPLLSYSKYY